MTVYYEKEWKEDVVVRRKEKGAFLFGKGERGKVGDARASNSRGVGQEQRSAVKTFVRGNFLDSVIRVELRSISLASFLKTQESTPQAQRYS